MAHVSPDAPMPTRTRFALDALNFALAYVRDGLGPYLAVYLLTVQHWDEERIGIVMSMAGLAGIAAQTPAGALIDATHAKRLVVACAALVVPAGPPPFPLRPPLLPGGPPPPALPAPRP